MRSLMSITMLVVCLVLWSCASKAPQQEKVAKEVEPAVPSPTIEKLEVDPCEAQISVAIKESRASNRTVKKSCDGMAVEVNPMWDLDYKGTVHIRVYDAAGKQIRDEISNPE